MKALVIDEPWISAILLGVKTWEMRRGVCNLRGPIALIRKGSAGKWWVLRRLPIAVRP